MKTHVRRGDLVEVISGNHKGATGKVLQILINKNQPNKKGAKKQTPKEQVIVEGVRMIKRHMRRSQEHPEGTILEKEGPIHLSNVRLLERDGQLVKKKKDTSSTSKKVAKATKKDLVSPSTKDSDKKEKKVVRKARKNSSDKVVSSAPSTE